MKKKIISIFVSMLLFVTVLSVTGATNIEKTVNMKLQSTSTDIFWEDGFDSYPLGPLHGQGGWEAWDNDPATTGYVTDNQSHSPDNSAEIAWYGGTSADMVYQFSGVSSGNWTLTTWSYVPSDMVGKSYILLLNKYEHGGSHVIQDWSLQLEVSASIGRISDMDNLDDWLPLITDEWVEIRVEIDFEVDIQTVYYDDVELLQKGWTDGVSPGGQKNLACIDLYADTAVSSEVYWDDFILEGEVGEDPDLDCDGALSWVNVSTGEELTGSFTVENVGGGLLDWEIVDEPSWGTWSFDPDSGDDLGPGDPVTVDVTVIAPDDKNEEFSGVIKIENKENSEDYCTIDVSLTTPRNKASNFNFPFLNWLFERFPNAFPALRYILGL